MSDVTIESIKRIKLEPGEVLAINIKAEDISSHALEGFRKRFADVFPNNRVIVTLVDSIEYIALSMIEQTPKFKTGDKVKIIDPGDETAGMIGVIDKVASIEDNEDNQVYFESLDDYWYYNDTQLELVTDGEV